MTRPPRRPSRPWPPRATTARSRPRPCISRDDSGATKGKVSSLTLTGVHNCCRSCTKAIKIAVKKVKGVTGDTAKPKSDTFEVTGDFEATDLIRALHKAGFHVKVKK